jgi:type I restriction enzyme M protein
MAMKKSELYSSLWEIGDKWLARLTAGVQSELGRVSQALTGRIRQLAERSTRPLPKLALDVESLAARVGKHLNRMGFHS